MPAREPVDLWPIFWAVFAVCLIFEDSINHLLMK